MQDIDKICQINGIKEKMKNAKNMDPSNRIFKSDSFVIKLYYDKKIKYYYNEIEVYNNLENKKYLPKIYHEGECENFKYIIMEKLSGISLFESWKNLNELEREKSIEQISIILKDINNIRKEKKNFKKEFSDDFYDSYDKINTSIYKSEFERIYLELVKYLNEEELCYLIHLDVHFYNFLYNDGKILAYDFENTLLAPIDYQLVRWYRMWKYPEDYYYPKDSLTSNEISSYSNIMNQLLQNYNEIANIKFLDKRVKLYELSYLLKEINRCNLPDEKVKKYLNDARKVNIYE